MKRALFFIALLIGAATQAQNDSLIAKNENFRKHLSLVDTFFGNEDLYQVCYPKDHRPMFYSIIIFSVASLVLGIFVICIKHTGNKKLKSKNQIIEEQNRDLLDSITYAQRIQTAMLPDEMTHKAFSSYGFIMYQPKHIVSGDFYWIYQLNDVLYVVVMDCTGHGVPGALLTILGYNAVSKTIIEKNMTDPASILDSMNTEIKEALKQNQNSEIKDSMEVGVIAWNKQTNKLVYAGAGIDLLIVQNNHTRIIKAAKCSVGSVQEHVKTVPSSHYIDVAKGDAVYLYTDGYADQFGGPDQKKFKYKQLENLLLSTTPINTNEQQEKLQAAFNTWKGSLEQVDDVTVVGLKFA